MSEGRDPEPSAGFMDSQSVKAADTVGRRSLAWLTAHRRLARDYERDPSVSEALIRWAANNTMIRRLDRGRPRHPTNPPHPQHARVTVSPNAARAGAWLNPA
ncbi:transposase IS4 family protein [Actinoplanes sp. N902-109]|nr:transposase IS4 family protein [Actinoplanes sp. N902-109]